MYAGTFVYKTMHRAYHIEGDIPGLHSYISTMHHEFISRHSRNKCVVHIKQLIIKETQIHTGYVYFLARVLKVGLKN